MTQRDRTGARPGNRRSGGQRRDAAAGSPVAAPRIDLAAARARVAEVIEPVVTSAGYDLEGVELSRAGRRHVVRVLVDGDGGISLDGVAVVSRAISAALDAAEEDGGEVVVGEYQLEVGSPGVDRPLTEPRHWRRNVGRLVAVDGRTGRVTAADDEGVMLDERRVAYPDLGPGRVQIEFKRLDEAVFEDAEDDEQDADDEQDTDDADGDGDEGEGGDR